MQTTTAKSYAARVKQMNTDKLLHEFATATMAETTTLPGTEAWERANEAANTLRTEIKRRITN